MPDGLSGGIGSGAKRTGAPGNLSMLLQELARAPRDDLERAWQKRLQPGDVVGRFEILREIARGGFGVVYEALDRQLGRSVAFKTLRPARTGHELSVDWILKEAEAVARLDHPAIVTLHDVGRCDWGPYLVEELLHGRTLEERLRDGPLPESDAVAVGLELARGLAHAHARGVLHRDLKPGNVFLTEDGRVKLLDFGLAHLLGTRGVQGAGTPAYMAPEQLRGEVVDARADVFALAATLFEAAAGKAPFEVKEGRSAALDEGAPPAPPEGTAAPLASLLYRCLSRDPAKRPASGQAVAEELLAVQRALDRARLEGRVPPARTPAPRRNLRLALVLAGVGAVVAGGVYRVAKIGLSSTETAGPATALPAPPSVAVLPFADMSPQHDQEYFADGVAEEILNALAQVQGLKVIGRTSSFSFKGKNEDLRTIGQKLGVRALLEGSVRKEGNHLRITAQLVGAEDGSHLWSQIFDRDQAGVFAVQEEIAQAVVGALRMKLLPGMAAPTRGVRTGNPEAYRLYLLGRDLAKRGTLDEWKRALAAHERALALDPEYAPAWAGVAFALRYIEGLGGEGTSPARRKRALDAADRAIALAPDLPDGYWVRAHGRMAFAYDWQGADADLNRARALSPSDVEVATTSGQLLLVLGRFPEAIDVLRGAAVLDPLSARAWERLGIAYTFAGDLERGREALRRSLDVVPEGPLTTLFLVMNLVPAGRPADALAAARRGTMDWLRNFGDALALKDLGRPDEARAALERLIARNADDSAYQIAEVYAWQGEPDRAFAWLERAYSHRDPGLQYTRSDPLLRPLHGDARWKPFLRKLNLPVD
jgi:eukaryotic-like serine/threonine-protein kinase